MFLLPQVSSVQSLSHIWLIATHGLQHARPPCPSPTPRACSNSCPSSRWCHPAISSSVVFHPTTALICWSPNSQSVGIWRWLDYAGGVSMMGLVPLEEETERLSSSPIPLPSSSSILSLPPPSPLKMHPGGSCPQARRCVLTGPWICQGFDFGFSASRNVRNRCLLSQPIYDIFVIATWMMILT